jgi:hypothetical protein
MNDEESGVSPIHYMRAQCWVWQDVSARAPLVLRGWTGRLNSILPTRRIVRSEAAQLRLHELRYASLAAVSVRASM